MPIIFVTFSYPCKPGLMQHLILIFTVCIKNYLFIVEENKNTNTPKFFKMGLSNGFWESPLGLYLAHLSQRLIGELIGYSWSGVHSSSVIVVRPQCSKIFLSEATWPIKAKFYVEPPWIGGTTFCSRHLGHMTKMATTPIYGKNPSNIFFSGTGGPILTKLGMYYRGLQPLIVCSNDDPGVTLTYFMARSNLVS